MTWVGLKIYFEYKGLLKYFSKPFKPAFDQRYQIALTALNFC